MSAAKLHRDEVITVFSVGQSSIHGSDDGASVSSADGEDIPVPFESFENKNGFFVNNNRQDRSSTQLSSLE